MKTWTVLALTIALSSTLACNSKPHEREHAATGSEPGLEPRATPPESAKPAATPAVTPEPEPEPEPTPEPDPALDERKLALANVGRGAFDALRAGKFDTLIKLTPLADGPLHDTCPRMPTSDRPELEARFKHCHETIPWDAVAEAQVFAGKPTGAQASGCDHGIEDYGRLQLFLHMSDSTIWRVDFFGAVGQDGNAVGINGEVACQTVAEAPPLE